MKQLLLLVGFLAGCDRVDAKQSSLGSIDGSRTVSSLSISERDRACAELAALEKRAFRDPVKLACEGTAVTETWSAAIDAVTKDKALSTAELRSLCASTRKACLANPEPQPESPATCQLHAMASCDVTIGEVLECSRESAKHLESIATQDLCALITTEHPVAGLNKLTESLSLPSCAALIKRCVNL
jgi:hypothetical protein